MQQKIAALKVYVLIRDLRQFWVNIISCDKNVQVVNLFSVQNIRAQNLGAKTE